MKHRLFFTLGIIIALSMVALTTLAQVRQMQPMQAAPPAIQVPAAPGPYYALPSWSQKLPAHVRFIVMPDWGNAAVLDKETGFVWERTPSPNKTVYNGAFMHCLESRVGNRTGWRLPKAHELASLVDPSATSYPALPPGHPFSILRQDQIGDKGYWTSNVFPGSEKNSHFTINFVYVSNAFFHFATASESLPAWCVRGPGELY